MKKILLLTTIYPAPDLHLLNNTNVCHYFAKEWVKMGYDVKVIFNYPIYSPILHKIAALFESQIASIGSAYVTTKRITYDTTYELDGVLVKRFPLYKMLPRISIAPKQIKKQIAKISLSNEEDNFTPNYIVAHFWYPHLEIVNHFKKLYNAKSCIVVHKQNLNIEKIYPNNYQELIYGIDIWGYRSKAIKNDFENKYKHTRKSFICNSGIPFEYISREKKHFKRPLSNFIYIGSLIERKKPLEILLGLHSLYNETLSFSLTYIGDGAERKKIEKYIKKYSLEKNVNLKGFISREEAQHSLVKADCFIMISKDESFGLVYLEAMAKGCITVASKGEGMDGIIIHGENGFLCQTGDYNELSSIVSHINSLPLTEIDSISNKARNTAMKFTDKIVGKEYLDNLLNVDNE